MYLVHGKTPLCQIKCFIWCRKRVATDSSHYFFEIQKISEQVIAYLDFRRRWQSLNSAGSPIGSGNADSHQEGQASSQGLHAIYLIYLHAVMWYVCQHLSICLPQFCSENGIFVPQIQLASHLDLYCRYLSIL